MPKTHDIPVHPAIKTWVKRGFITPAQGEQLAAVFPPGAVWCSKRAEEATLYLARVRFENPADSAIPKLSKLKRLCKGERWTQYLKLARLMAAADGTCGLSPDRVAQLKKLHHTNSPLTGGAVAAAFACICWI